MRTTGVSSLEVSTRVKIHGSEGRGATEIVNTMLIAAEASAMEVRTTEVRPQFSSEELCGVSFCKSQASLHHHSVSCQYCAHVSYWHTLT